MEIVIKVEGLQGLATAITQMAIAMTGGKAEEPKAIIEEKAVKQEPKETKPKTTVKADVKTEVKEGPKKEADKVVEESTEETTEDITLEVLRAKASDLAKAGKREELKNALTKCGASKLTEVPEDKYNELFKLMGGI